MRRPGRTPHGAVRSGAVQSFPACPPRRSPGEQRGAPAAAGLEPPPSPEEQPQPHGSREGGAGSASSFRAWAGKGRPGPARSPLSARRRRTKPRAASRAGAEPPSPGCVDRDRSLPVCLSARLPACRRTDPGRGAPGGDTPAAGRGGAPGPVNVVPAGLGGPARLRPPQLRPEERSGYGTAVLRNRRWKARTAGAGGSGLLGARGAEGTVGHFGGGGGDVGHFEGSGGDVGYFRGNGPSAAGGPEGSLGSCGSSLYTAPGSALKPSF